MNMICFFYDIFNVQELVLKFNNLDSKKIVNVKKCIVFNGKEPEDKNQNEIASIDNFDYIYTLEFLTNAKITKSRNDKFKTLIKLKKRKCLDLFLFLNCIVFNKFPLVLENAELDKTCPLLLISNKTKNLALESNNNFVEFEFRNGINLSFLAKSEFVSLNSIPFFVRIIFDKQIKEERYKTAKHFIWLSLSGLKFNILSKKQKQKKKKKKNKHV